MTKKKAGLGSKKQENQLVKDRGVLVSFFLRSGLAIVFFYAATAALLSPDSWVGFIPQFVRNIVDPYLFLKIHFAFEAILGLWLLSNKKIFYAAVIAVLDLLSIIIFNIGALDIVFRDITILFAAIALAVLSYKKSD